jgi:hypothetical protein
MYLQNIISGKSFVQKKLELSWFLFFFDLVENQTSNYSKINVLAKGSQEIGIFLSNNTKTTPTLN